MKYEEVKVTDKVLEILAKPQGKQALYHLAAEIQNENGTTRTLMSSVPLVMTFCLAAS